MIRVRLLLIIAVLLTISCNRALTKISVEEIRWGLLETGDDQTTLDQLMQSDRNQLALVKLDGNSLNLWEFDRVQNSRQMATLGSHGILFYYHTFSPTSALTAHRSDNSRVSKQLLARGIDVAEKLSLLPDIRSGYVLILDAIDEITDEQASFLAALPVDYLLLDGLKYISEKQAGNLSQFAGTTLCLNGLLWLGREQADAIAKFKGDCLFLDGLRTLDKHQARSLAQFEGARLGLASLDLSSKALLDKIEKK